LPDRVMMKLFCSTACCRSLPFVTQSDPAQNSARTVNGDEIGVSGFEAGNSQPDYLNGTPQSAEGSSRMGNGTGDRGVTVSGRRSRGRGAKAGNGPPDIAYNGAARSRWLVTDRRGRGRVRSGRIRGGNEQWPSRGQSERRRTYRRNSGTFGWPRLRYLDKTRSSKRAARSSRKTRFRRPHASD